MTGTLERLRISNGDRGRRLYPLLRNDSTQMRHILSPACSQPSQALSSNAPNEDPPCLACGVLFKDADALEDHLRINVNCKRTILGSTVMETPTGQAFLLRQSGNKYVLSENPNGGTFSRVRKEDVTVSAFTKEFGHRPTVQEFVDYTNSKCLDMLSHQQLELARVRFSPHATPTVESSLDPEDGITTVVFLLNCGVIGKASILKFLRAM